MWVSLRGVCGLGVTHVGDLGGRALDGLRRRAEAVVHTGAAAAAPHTLVGGAGVPAEAAVVAAHRAVVERHCSGERGRKEEELKDTSGSFK